MYAHLNCYFTCLSVTSIKTLFKIQIDEVCIIYDVGGGQTRTDETQRVRDLQSLAIATMRHPRERKDLLAKGLEPSTIRLQVGRSTS